MPGPSGTGTAQRRSDELRSNLEDHFLTNREFYENGARLLNAGSTLHREGGGALMYDWLADRLAVESYIGSQQLTGINIGWDDWAATIEGGPYLDCDGTEAAYVLDASWQEPGANNLLVWHWVNAASVAVLMAISGKWDVNGNQRSWRLTSTGGPSLRFSCNPLGVAVNTVSLDSSVIPVIDTWYFFAGFFQPSTLMRTWVALASDATPTIDSLAAGIPASLFDGTSPLAIGCSFNNAPTPQNQWDGLIGRGAARVGVPAANINAHVSRLFYETREFYQ